MMMKNKNPHNPHKRWKIFIDCKKGLKILQLNGLPISLNYISFTHFLACKMIFFFKDSLFSLCYFRTIPCDFLQSVLLFAASFNQQHVMRGQRSDYVAIMSLTDGNWRENLCLMYEWKTKLLLGLGNWIEIPMNILS